MPEETERVTQRDQSAKFVRNQGTVMKSWWIGVGAVLSVILVAAGVLYYYYEGLPEYWQGISVETGGMFLEAVFVLAAFGGYEKWRSKKDEIARLKERVEDVKRIDDPHAKGIVASAVRALARFKITDIDFRGVRLTSFSFAENDISSIAGSTFSDGIHLLKASRNFAELTDVDFSWIDCREVCFGSGNLSLATYISCSFQYADLRNARFKGVTLSWPKDEIKADEGDWSEKVDTDTDGRPISTRVYNPAFDGANLAGCSFKDARLSYADFRGALHIDQADFTGATGLETCFFDDQVLAAHLTKIDNSLTV